MISFPKSAMSLFAHRIAAAIGYVSFPHLPDYSHLTSFLET
jgi:hypothetical protein